MTKRKIAQSEMVGFGIIIIIVAILILIFISFTLNSGNQEIKSYETQGFVQSVLQYTTNCSISSQTNYLTYLELVKSCYNSENCFNGNSACSVLNDTSKDILENSWKVGDNLPLKGYSFEVIYSGENLVSISKGSPTKEITGSRQTFSNDLDVIFRYYS